MAPETFEALIDEADRRPFVGWDVSYDGRIRSAPPWDFAAIVGAQARASPDLLDIGTGGGEWLSALPHRPRRTVAVEGWPPNVEVARRRLEPLGVPVLAFEGAPDNVEQTAASEAGVLPFEDGAFHLVVSRHEAYRAAEVLRVLAPGGRFLTQQVGAGAADDLYRLLGEPAPQAAVRWDLAFAVRQLQDAGFLIEQAEEGFETITFADVGALAWYLKNLPFMYEGFSIPAARDRLRALHGRPIAVRQPLFWLAARSP